MRASQKLALLDRAAISVAEAGLVEGNLGGGLERASAEDIAR